MLLFLWSFLSASRITNGLNVPPKSVDRRRLLQGPMSLIALGKASSPSWAEPGEFKNIDTQAPLPLGKEGDAPFVTLSNGVKVKEFKVGTNSDEVTKGSTVSVQVVGRLLNLNGVAFFDSKKNNPDGFGGFDPLVFTVGTGVALPGLESGILGMRKGGVRRIIVPSELGYSKFPGLEPRPTTDLDQRALDSVIQNPRRDASLLFDVKLERVK